MTVQRLSTQVSMLVAISTLLVQQEAAIGQLIGNRTLGAPASSLSQQRAAGTASSSNIGMSQASNASGSPRFVRGNRTRQDFVGSNRSELNRFVGSGQALGVGRVPSAVENLRIETSKAKINRPLPPQPATGMYYPRLEIDFDTASLPGEILREGPANQDLRARIAEFSSGGAVVTISGNTAILRGTVNSIRTSELLVQILSFEPGIDRVKNELVIQ